MNSVVGCWMLVVFDNQQLATNNQQPNTDREEALPARKTIDTRSWII
jgi:hypothetical protein